MEGLIAYVLSKRLLIKSLDGLGVIKGSPCTIERTDPIYGEDGTTKIGNTITFKWTGISGAVERKLLDVYDGKEYKTFRVDPTNEHIIVTYRDGSQDDIGDGNIYSKDTIDQKDETILSDLATLEDGTTAQSTYAEGDYLVRLGQFYRVKKAIAIGDSFSATNIEPYTIAEALLHAATDAKINGHELKGDKADYELELEHLVWKGTRAEYNALAEPLPEGTIVYILDDYQSGGGGGSSSLEDDLNVTTAVGGVTVGTYYPTDTPLEDIFRDMLDPVKYPTFTSPSATLTATGNKLLETGSTLSTTMTITLNRGHINPAYGTSGYRSGAATGYSLNGGVTQTTNTFSVTVDESNLTYIGVADYAAGEQPKDSKGNNYSTPLAAGSVNTNSIVYEFVDAIWANTAAISTVAKLALVSKSAKVKQFDFPDATIASPERFDIPASWNITAVEVKNDLSGAYEDCSSEFTTGTTTHNDAAGNPVNYVTYTDNRGYDAGARTIRVKWS